MKIIMGMEWKWEQFDKVRMWAKYDTVVIINNTINSDVSKV